MRALFLPRHDRDLDVFEAARLEKLMELHFAEAEPVVRVKLTRALETVAEQIENHDPPALAQHPVSARDRPLRMDRVMERLAQDREGDRAVFARRIFDVTEAVLEIREPVPLRQ